MPYLDFAYSKVQTKAVGLDIAEDSAVDKGTFLHCGEKNFDVFIMLFIVSLPF